MSERFYEKFLSTLGKFIILGAIFIVSVEMLIFYVFNPNTISYYAYCGSLIFAVFYGIHSYHEYRHFKENINLFIPNENNTQPKPLDPLKIEALQHRSLKACLLYRNGSGFEYVAKALQLGKSRFGSGEQGKREVDARLL